MKTLLTLLLLIPSLSFSEVNKENDQSLNNNEDGIVDKYFDKILDFAVSNSVSTLMHEMGHYYIDVLDIPTFGQEEDIADSFITMYLIHKPEQYGDYEAYEYYSSYDHNYIKGIVNNFFYLILLGRDTEYVSGTHSNDKKRFYNIICGMKDGNPDVFDEFVSSRDINYELDYDCEEGVHTDIWNSWSEYLTGMWHGDGADYIGEFILNFEDAKIDENGDVIDFYPGVLKVQIENVSERLFDDFHIQLPTDVIINFRYCDGEINAFYYPGYYQIDFCYELFQDYLMTALDVYYLKESL